MSNLRWDLSSLYPGFDAPEFKNDIKTLESMIEDFNLWTDHSLTMDDPGAALEGYITRAKELRKLSSKAGAFTSLTLSVDSHHVEARQIQNRLRSFSGDMTKLSVRLIQYLKDIDDLDNVIAGRDLLKEHDFYLKEQKQAADHLLSEKEEIIISRMRNTGSSAFSTLQQDLTANLMIEVELDGETKELPLAAVRNLAFHKDADVRKNAYHRELAAYPAVEETSAAALNAIKGEVITVAELKGYLDPMEETLIDSRMTRDTLDALLTALEEYLPWFRKYLKRKGELLGYENGLPFYEMFAPVGEISLNYSYDEAMACIIDNFKGFSPRLAGFAETAYAERWLDVEPRAGKRGGAFCMNLPAIGESRIMANFSGSFNNMTTLAHELGHGYHGLNLKDESILNTSYPMPIAETASIFNETIITNAAMAEAGPEEKLAILESSLSKDNQVITDIYSRYLFETELFSRRKDSTLSVTDLNELMLESQKKAYGDGLDNEHLHPYMWVNKPHYYRAGLSWYNFPYAFGLLFAKGLYAKYMDMGEEFLPLYDQLLSQTGKKDIRSLCASVGIDIEDPAFFRSSLELIKGEIQEFLSLTEKGRND